MRWVYVIILASCLIFIPGVSALGFEPVSSFSATPVSGFPPLSVQFNDLSEGSPTSWLWLFGDGGTSTEQNPEHIYQNEGIYDVFLTTANAYGQSTSQRVKYIRVGIEPTPNFVANPLIGSPPHEVQFSDKSTGNPKTWLWNFGDGTTSTEQNPIHTYNLSGRYDVTLQVSNAVGTGDRIKEQYIAIGYPPSAKIGVSPTTGYAPLTVTFMDLSDETPYSWFWTFGDGGTSTDQNPVHTYSSSGTYPVTLTVENLFGSDNASLQSSIHVNPPVTASPTEPAAPSPPGSPLVAHFIGAPRTGDAPHIVRFTDTSTGGPTWWRWSFGDGLLSSEMSPTHTFTSPGNYSVTLTIKNDYSTDSLTREEYIRVTGEDTAPIVTEIPVPMTSVFGIEKNSDPAESYEEYEDCNSLSSTDYEGGLIGSWWWIILLLVIIVCGVALYWWKFIRKSRSEGWF